MPVEEFALAWWVEGAVHALSVRTVAATSNRELRLIGARAIKVPAEMVYGRCSRMRSLVLVLPPLVAACSPSAPPVLISKALSAPSAQSLPSSSPRAVTSDMQAGAGAPSEAPSRALPGVALATGEKHACVLKSDGAVYCWGENADGQLGDPADLGKHTLPVRVAGLPPAAAISAGGAVSCAVTKGARLFCWGDAIYGQLASKLPDCKADGAEPRNRYAQCSPHPVEIPLKDVSHVVVGRHHACAATLGGAVTCWGGNEYGQVGGVKDETRYLPPTRVRLAGNGEVVQLYGQTHEQCALQTDGTVTCWGSNGFAQACRTGSPLGPTAIDAFRGADELGGSGRMFCGRKGSTVTCCGAQTWKKRVEKHGRETITSDDETTRYKTSTIVPELAGAERLAATEEALCGRVKGVWRCVADVLMVDDPERNKNAVIPAPPDDLARVSTFSQHVFLRDDGVVLVPSGSTLLGPTSLTQLAW